MRLDSPYFLPWIVDKSFRRLSFSTVQYSTPPGSWCFRTLRELYAIKSSLIFSYLFSFPLLPYSFSTFSFRLPPETLAGLIIIRHPHGAQQWQAASLSSLGEICMPTDTVKTCKFLSPLSLYFTRLLITI